MVGWWYLDSSLHMALFCVFICFVIFLMIIIRVHIIKSANKEK